MAWVQKEVNRCLVWRFVLLVDTDLLGTRPKKKVCLVGWVGTCEVPTSGGVAIRSLVPRRYSASQTDSFFFFGGGGSTGFVHRTSLGLASRLILFGKVVWRCLVSSHLADIAIYKRYVLFVLVPIKLYLLKPSSSRPL